MSDVENKNPDPIQEDQHDSDNQVPEDELNLAASKGARRWTMLALVIAFVALLGAMLSSNAWLNLETDEPVNVAERYTSVPGPSSTPTMTMTATASATPTLTPTMTATPTPAYIEYSVVRGDTMLSVAQSFDTSVDILFSINGLTENDVLSIGQILKIPVNGDEVVLSTEVPEATPTPVATVVSEATTEEPAASQTIHTVTAGQNLLVIAQMYGVTQQEIADANDMGVNDILSIGQKLIIPVEGGTATPVVHKVISGENLLIIARTYGVTQQEIATANGIDVDDILSIGQELVIPLAADDEDTVAVAEPTATPTVEPERATVHKVVSGEYIESIAAHYGVSADEILAANNLTLTSVLSIGQEIIIPAGGTAATRTPEPTATPLPGMPTVTPVPTLTPAASESINYVYTKPYLLSPVNGAAFTGDDATILLNWTSSGILEPYEWYLVRIWPSDIGEEEIEIWTQATSVRLAEGLRPAQDEKQQLLWQVTVVSRYSEAEIGTPLSPSSTSRTIIWY